MTDYFKKKRVFTKYYFLIAVMGFFSIVSQTLLFRRFLIAFEGNELSIGLFFFSWLIWICIGAFTAKQKTILKLVDFFPVFLFLYILFFAFQFYVFQFSQFLTGTSFYETVSIEKITVFVFLFNAPVSFLTGFLFVSATGWINKKKEFDVAVIKVYICEALGSFIGASSVTLLLYFSFSEERIFLIAVLIIFIFSMPVILEYKSKTVKIIHCLLAVIVFFFFISNLPDTLKKLNYIQQWNTLIHGGNFSGGFSTPQAEYVYGKYKNEFIVLSSNSIYESIPNLDISRNVVAECMAQKPGAENIMVIGPGTFSVCTVFEKLPQIKNIYQLDTDPEYSTKLKKILPEKDNKKTIKLKIITQDARSYLQSIQQKFDLIILYLPAPSNLLLNRYFTEEFFIQLKNIITKKGVIGVSFPGGDNFIGPELSFLGSSVYITLKKVFKYIVLKPGLESTFYVSDSPNEITESSTVLTRRLRKIEGLNKFYNPGQIRSSYEKNRIDFQISVYDNIIKNVPEGFLINSDKNPRSFLYTLLFTIKKISNLQLTFPKIKLLLISVFPISVLILVLYFVLRILYRKVFYKNVKGIGKEKYFSKTEVYFSVFAAAVIGMGLNILLLFLFQINYGTVYLCFGLITAFFMLGMCINAFVIDILLRQFRGQNIYYCFSILFLFFIFLILLFPPLNSLGYFGISFFFSGFFCGAYFPLAGFFINRINSRNECITASTVEIFDNLGGAFGSFICSIILIPVIGVNYSLLLFAVLMIIVILHVVFIKSDKDPNLHITVADKLRNIIRISGFTLTGICVLMLFFFSFIKKEKNIKTEKNGFIISSQQLKELTGISCESVTKSIKVGNSKISYLEIFNGDKNRIGYIFRTKDFTDYDKGYAGPINMVSYVSSNGRIQNFTVVDSNETPAYLDAVLKNKKIFLGQNSFGDYKDYDINAVTGATVSSKAVSETLYRAGSNFKAKLGNKTVNSLVLREKTEISLSLILLIIFCIAAVYLKMIKNKINLNKWVRMGFLTLTAIVFGFIYNIQYSSDQLFSLLSGNFTLTHITAFTFLCIGIPLLIILFGNIYCGYLCPFGALQELTNKIYGLLGLNFSNNASVEKKIWIIGRSFKYLILFGIVLLFIISGNRNLTNNFDVLLSFFRLQTSSLMFYLSLLLIFISLFFNRFWCRILCPSGAFLNIFNGIHKIFFRKTKIVTDRCDIGVIDKNDFDCICCNKCLYKEESTQKTTRKTSVVFVLLILISTFLSINEIIKNYNQNRQLSTINFPETLKVKTSQKSEESIKAVKESYGKQKRQKKKIRFSKSSSPLKSIGQPRKINIQVYRDYINKSYLSDHEAMFYRKLDE